MIQFDVHPFNLGVRTLLAQQGFPEKRREARRECTSCVAVVPLDSERRETGPLMIGHCIDVSDEGLQLSLMHTIDAPYLYIEPMMATAELRFQSATLEVLRRMDDGGCCTYAGRFA